MTTRADFDWHDQAACRGRDDIDWFPTQDRPGGTTAAHRANLAAARAVCAGCEVKDRCLEDALSRSMCAGLWGGTTEHERDMMGRRAPLRIRPAKCGTDSGYYHHLRHSHTLPCDDCKAAHAIAARVRKWGMAR